MKKSVQDYKREIWDKYKRGLLKLVAIRTMSDDRDDENHNIAIRAARNWALKQKDLKKEKLKTKKKKTGKGMSVAEAKRLGNKTTSAPTFYGTRSRTLTGAYAKLKEK